MQAEERRKHIEEYLLKAEFASLEELGKQVGASISTVRRDLTALESQGTIRRTHGGARLVNPRSEEFIFTRRDTIQLNEKEAIGMACARLIEPHQSVIIDAGTTVFHAARHLEGKPLQIITNSLPVANHFGSTPSIEVIVSGGVIYPRLGVLVGPMTVDTFARTHADVAIMSGGGITPAGVTNSHALLIDIQRAMIRAARKIILCMDHTKLGRLSVAPMCDLASIDILVTDSAAPAGLVEQLRSAGLEVIVAEPVSALPGVERPARLDEVSSERAETAKVPSPSPVPALTEPPTETPLPKTEVESPPPEKPSDLVGEMSWD